MLYDVPYLLDLDVQMHCENVSHNGLQNHMPCRVNKIGTHTHTHMAFEPLLTNSIYATVHTFHSHTQTLGHFCLGDLCRNYRWDLLILSQSAAKQIYIYVCTPMFNEYNSVYDWWILLRIPCKRTYFMGYGSRLNLFALENRVTSTMALRKPNYYILFIITTNS